MGKFCREKNTDREIERERKEWEWLVLLIGVLVGIPTRENDRMGESHVIDKEVDSLIMRLAIAEVTAYEYDALAQTLHYSLFYILFLSSMS